MTQPVPTGSSGSPFRVTKISGNEDTEEETSDAYTRNVIKIHSTWENLTSFSCCGTLAAIRTTVNDNRIG